MQRELYYYDVAVVGQPTGTLTYSSPYPLKPADHVEVSIRNRRREGYVVAEVEKPPFACQEVHPTGRYLPEGYWLTARLLAAYYLSPLGVILELFFPFLRQLPTLSPPDGLASPLLSLRQSQALKEVMQPRTTLLFGDTGSGKTEIYAAAIAKTLAAGGSAILLMPEIGLTPQMEKRLKHYFDKMVAVWHSKQSKARKRQILEGIESGEVRVVAGARSALFLPVVNLGLIVVDEEHDDSYKASGRPLYHARDAAIALGDRLSIPVILGSATPSVTSWSRFPSVRLKGTHHASHRVYEFIPPSDEIPGRMIDALASALAKKEQSIVFVPTRGNFKYLICRDCGATIECPHCSVAKSLHRSSGSMRCHYCGHQAPIPTHCPSCGGTTLEAQRLGTAEMVGRLQELLPQARIAKFDRDEITSETRLRTILSSFSKGEIDILVGTQMVAKGHDYPRVGLTIIWGADYLMTSADFRAKEKAIQTMIQIAGRSGRQREGRVMIISAYPERIAPYLEDYDRLLVEETDARRELFPPHRKLARILFVHKKQYIAQQQMEAALKLLRSFTEVEIVGWGTAPIERMNDEWRFYIMVRALSSKVLLQALSCISSGIIDVDPISFS
ncbi:MAG: primosomal protein N' [Campylobacterales bacterium]